ncbi:type III PLP-dependent enzyme [Amycolatopsis cihanbeyliensis]|uniref:ornithine decarboxylase n=1 Tax=Amycolatopsis cihanbeyliensis TaxID=1128664 RepID=A0A542DDQ3_AMYCI|nr:type III PLP-dependent enzyme [Amycolatopsis cihanbeyliensis]TQJ01186.1 ornithine decarboxylase [Amycolatopsis cihanbeyliensis]
MSTTFDRIRRFLTEHAPSSPCLVIDLDAVADRYREVAAAFENARVCYAVKANPAPPVISTLVSAGASFDVASPAEIKLCLAAGADPESLSYGNPIKKPSAIEFAHNVGVREFTCDAEGDLDNIARFAPGAQVQVRLLVEAPDSVTPFGRKFGCVPRRATELLLRAVELGLEPTGVSFHVGSQQLDPAAWELAAAAAATVFTACAEQGTTLRRLNIGGGFGVSYDREAPSLAEYAGTVDASLRAHFGQPLPELVLEPGRAMVAEAGLIRAEVVLVARKSATDPARWVYLDIGRYNGLAETENEAIAYRFEPVDDTGTAEEEGPVIIAGPTCDGDDVLYQHTPYRLPLALRAGDQLDILATGAYTASYSSVAFNGIEPLPTYCITGGRLISAH